MVVSGTLTYIAKDLYDRHVKPLLQSQESPNVIEQPSLKEEVSEHDEQLSICGFKRCGNGYTALFK